MEQISRRAAIVAGASMITGCSSISGASEPTPEPTPEDSDYDGVPDEEDEYPDDSLLTKRIKLIEDEVTLRPDDYKAYPIQVPDGVHVIKYDILVEGEYGVDMLFMKRDKYVEYTSGKETSYLTEYSQMNIGSGTLEQVVDEGRYAYVVDYTNYGTVYGPGEVTATVTIELISTPSAG